MIKREIMPYVWVHPDEARHVLGKCHSEQARAKQDKTGNGHSEETVRSEFFTHGTPPAARELRIL
jgi:hypothetical protein